MDMPSSETKSLTYYSVWDRTTRSFHWINVLCIIALAGIGLVLLNDDALDINRDGKVLLKTIHVYIGYLFVLNLVWRFVWGFIGNRYARWRSVLPVGAGYWQSVSQYVSGVRSGKVPHYLGHNPVARLMVALLFLLLTVQAVSGLVLAGTDLYMPPFGDKIANWVSVKDQDGHAATRLIPGSRVGVDAAALKDMRHFRKPFGMTHETVFFILVIAIMLHVLAVVVTEIREMNGLVSAMFTGKKIMSGQPVDRD